jgi:6-phosphogluconolactonase
VTKPALQIFTDQAAISQAAAQYFLQIASEAVATRGRFGVTLSGGSTPEELYRLLSQSPFDRNVPWPQTHVFWGDERLVPPDEPGSNYGQAAELLLDRVPIPAENVHRAKGELEPAAAVADYTNQLRDFSDGQHRWPHFDLVLLGLGSDGHTASLFPGSIPAREAREPVISVTADYDGRPAHRLTLTPPVFNDARLVIFLVAGGKKAEALAAVLQGPHNLEQWPAQRIQPQQGSVTWLVDQAAASQLNNPQG